MSGQDNHLWLQAWRDKQTEFHQIKVNQLLTRFWPGIDQPSDSRVFVPLCGKSLDMIWLAGLGHHVIGVELSPIAVQDFFSENGLQPAKQQLGEFTLWSAGNISILCGDYFSLDKNSLGKIDTVYDRASLTALPENIRQLYVAQLRLIVPRTTEIFLLTIEDAEEDDSLSYALGIDDEITDLFSEGFRIKLAHVESVFEPDLQSLNPAPKRVEYKLYRLFSR